MATGDERLEEATGPVNGSNVFFSTPTPYQSGTLYILENGWFLPSDDDRSADELVPAAGTFQLRTAPADNDRVLVRYLEA